MKAQSEMIVLFALFGQGNHEDRTGNTIKIHPEAVPRWFFLKLEPIRSLSVI